MPIPLLAPVIAVAVAATASLAGYLWGRDIWRWLTRTPPPKLARGRARVLVAGPTGIGKTTLIRQVVGADVGTIGEGTPKTPGIEWLGSADFPVWFADSKGLEVVTGSRQVADIRNKLASWREEDRPHLAWLCVQADSARIMESADDPEGKRVLGTEGDLGGLLHELGIPALVVLTQADVGGAELDAMRARARQVFPFARDVVAVCAEPRTLAGRVLIPRHGLKALRAATLALLPDKLSAKTAKAWKPPDD
jgi:energy-coupling factor transporter ATP-binding protein EcfA2